MDMTNFSVGFARLDITPHLGVPIGGYFEPRFTKGVLDPLFVNALAFGDGEKSAVLLVADLCGLNGNVGDIWPGEIAQAVGVAPESVILCCTHTHTSAALCKDEVYDAFLLQRLKDAATIALNDRKPLVDIRWAEGHAEGMTFVRRWKLSDGTVMTNPPKSVRDMIVAPACECDDSLRVVRFIREDAPEIIMGNFQSHPDNIGGELISADFPGAFRARVEQLCENTYCIFTNGCQGQMITTDRRLPNPPACHERATAHGKKLAEMAVALLHRCVSTEMTGLSFGRLAVDLKTKRDPSRVPESERIIELYNADRWEEYTTTRKQANYMVAEARKIVMLEKLQQDYRTTAVCAISFCGLALVGMPGEPFNEVGVQIRGNSKFPVTCALCIANGSHGYFPTALAHEQGGYEAYNTPYVKGTAEQLADTADKLLASL